jgi:hypothetical protein
MALRNQLAHFAEYAELKPLVEDSSEGQSAARVRHLISDPL